MPPRGRRLILQYLEPSPELDALAPGEAADRLQEALELAPVTDVCLGWALPSPLLEAVARVARTRATLWRWLPVLAGDGVQAHSSEDLAIGPSGSPPPPFGGLDTFRFLCPNRPGVVEAAIERVVSTAAEVPVGGIFLDRIRWPSPSAAPVADLACFCDRCRRLAAHDGLDLPYVAAEMLALDQSLDGRRRIVRGLLGSRPSGLLGRFLRWRAHRMSEALLALVDAVAERGVRRIGLDVFTPVLARTVGQDIARIGRPAEWVKSMTYLSTWGPAGMPFELAGYARWLEAAGDDDPPAFLARVCGFPVAAGADLRSSGIADGALSVEIRRLRRLCGSRAALGLDVVEVPGVTEVPDSIVARRAAIIAEAGMDLVPSWDLRHMTATRIAAIAEGYARAQTS